MAYSIDYKDGSGAKFWIEIIDLAKAIEYVIELHAKGFKDIKHPSFEVALPFNRPLVIKARS